jgi:hypothetical protein
MFGLLKFNMEGNRVKRDQRSTYRKSNPRQLFKLNHDFSSESRTTPFESDLSG